MTLRPGHMVLALLVLVPTAGLALVLLAPTAPLRQPIAARTGVPVGLVLGAMLFATLARGGRRPLRIRPPGVVAAALAVAAAGAGEEAVWRGFALARLAAGIGVAGALVATTAAFAATHFPALRLRGVAVHLGTGSVFGLLFVGTGSLVCAAAAHGAYNLLAVCSRGAAAPGSAVCLRGVEKRFGEIAALRGVDLSIEPGQTVALLGPNGAGKTTLLSIVLGLRRPDAGRVELFGRDPRRWQSRTVVGTTPQETSFPPTLRCREVVDFVRAHYPSGPSTNELLERFDLCELGGRQTGGLSGGQRQRLGVALAFAGAPRLVVLDEPTSGLDVEARRGVWSAIRTNAATDGTTLIATHNLQEAEALAGRIVVVARGAVCADGTAAAIKQLAGGGLDLEDAFLELVRGAP